MISPPLGGPGDLPEVMRLTPGQIFSYFGIERHEDGRPKGVAPAGFKSAAEYRAEYLRDQCGVWEPDAQRRAWAAWHPETDGTSGGDG